MFTGKVGTDDSRQESNLAAKQPHRTPHHVIQVTTSEGLAQGPYVVTIELDSAPKGPNTATEPPRPININISALRRLARLIT